MNYNVHEQLATHLHKCDCVILASPGTEGKNPLMWSIIICIHYLLVSVCSTWFLNCQVSFKGMRSIPLCHLLRIFVLHVNAFYIIALLGCFNIIMNDNS